MPWTGERLGVDEIGDDNWGTRMGDGWSKQLSGDRRAIDQIATSIESSVNYAITEPDDFDTVCEQRMLVAAEYHETKGFAHGWCLARHPVDPPSDDYGWSACDDDNTVSSCMDRLLRVATRLARLRIARRNRCGEWTGYGTAWVQRTIAQTICLFDPDFRWEGRRMAELEWLKDA